MLEFAAVIPELTVAYKFNHTISVMGNLRTVSILYLKLQFPTYPLDFVLTIMKTIC